MNRLHTAIFGAGLAFLGLIASASANTILTFGDANSVCSAIPGSSANLSHEAGYINALVPLSAGSHTIGAYVYGRTTNFQPPAGLPTATDIAAVQSPSGPSNLGIDITGYRYLLGKYGNADYVWFVGSLSGLANIPLLSNSSWDTTIRGNADGHGLSHWAVFNPTAQVPDGGTTVTLLGLGLIGLASIRRLFRR